MCKNMFRDCMDCAEDLFQDKREEKCCQTQFYACRIPYRETEEINDVNLYIVLQLQD